ncbi:L10-interacting MYB domain-containing protein, partial [Mucuna pruriens]
MSVTLSAAQKFKGTYQSLNSRMNLLFGYSEKSNPFRARREEWGARYLEAVSHQGHNGHLQWKHISLVHRGNRMGYTFNKQAWNEMLTLLNANFGSSHDVYLLKSHYMSLWTQFNDIKNLLYQNGFSWDETRQMVIASDHVWDAYIKVHFMLTRLHYVCLILYPCCKVHPHAQAYQSKAPVNIKDLCLIYAHKSADGRYSLSSHDMDFADDDQVLNTGSGVAARTRAPVTRECPDADWTLPMDCYFVKLMLGQLKNGNMIHNTFRKKAWNHMLKCFNKKFDAQYDKSFLKHRYNKLGNYHTDVKSLLDLKDFSWDENQQRIVADDYVWDGYIKAHPHASSYRNKTLVSYRDLGLIYGNAMCSAHSNYMQEGRQNEYHSSDDNEYEGGSWTSHMDCYLTDLLLNQALKGNKTSHDFTYDAWCEIVTSFHLKFGSHYTKYALKNRYKYLKSQYTDLKVLTKQPGFARDGKQEMVMDKDEVHPDALSYGSKYVPIYHKLCLIHGHEIFEGRCSHSSCSADHISNDPISSMGVDEDTQDCALGDCSRTDWTPSMNRYLIDVMLEEVQKGNKIDYVLNNQAWSKMVVLFKERFGKQFDKDYLKNCCKGLENIYHNFRSLLEQRGFSWDEMQQMITAYDGVWDAYIKEHPDVHSYRNRRKPNYNDLCLIFGNSETELTCSLANQNVGYMDRVKFQNFHWRCDWTPPMDRYFVDLMLEEVRNGSIVDHRFDRITWRDMVAKFSAEFGSQYNKDVLKSRYMTLRKIFNDMKILLNQSGFAWDEMQQRITADERLWNAYVKVLLPSEFFSFGVFDISVPISTTHPDMYAYRNRTLPNFNDLFLIYGNTNSGRNQNYSDCCRGSKDNDPGTAFLEAQFKTKPLIYLKDYLGANVWEYSHSPANDEPMRIAWTVKMNHYLIGILLEQLNSGNKIGDTFSKKAWSRMTASFNREFGLLCDRDALENRYFGLMRAYKDVTYLLNQNGIAWDEIQHVSRANNVWQAYFEVHYLFIGYIDSVQHMHLIEYADAVAFGETFRSNYSDLCLLFGNLNQNRIMGRVRIKLKSSNNNFGVETKEIMGDLQSSAREFKTSYGRKKRKSQAVLTSSNAGKVQKTLLGEMQDYEEEKDNSIERIVAALQTIPDLDDELFLEACLLLEDKRKARMFVAMDSSARRRWLLRKLQI